MSDETATSYSPEIEELLAPLRQSLRQRYTTGAQLGGGGMGTVVGVTDASIRRQVAMKRLQRPDGPRLEEVHRFLTEARITGQLEHPGIVPVHELSIDAEGCLYYTMKLVRGESLAAILSRLRDGGSAAAQYPLSRLLSIFLKVCDAIAYAHANGVVHRDLKPENIMVGDFGEVLVLDWGIAKILRRRSAPESVTASSVPMPETAFQTMAGQVMGTPAYMPPEQAAGRVREVDERSDVYSLGAILYHLLTLRPPIEGESVEEMLFKVVRGDVAHPAESAPGWKVGETALPHCPGGRVPPALASIAMHAMAGDPEQRYQSVADLSREVETAMGSQTMETAGGERLGPALAGLVRRHRAASWLVAGGALILLGLAAGYILHLRSERDRAIRLAPTASQVEWVEPGQ